MAKRFTGERLADLKLRGAIALIASVAAILAFSGAVLVRWLDPGIGSFGDALWWAVTTVSTVGYGDVVPTDTSGRLVGVALMLVGISLMPTVTSLVVSVFIAQRTREQREQDEALRKELLRRIDALDERLGRLDHRGG
jgi:voltage-gated potassium channel